MIIDCDRCQVRGAACGDCVVGVLLGVPEVPLRRASSGQPARPAAPGVPVVSDSALPSGAPTLQLDARERRALEVLADQGLIPRLRLVAVPERRGGVGGHAVREVRDAG